MHIVATCFRHNVQDATTRATSVVISHVALQAQLTTLIAAKMAENLPVQGPARL